MIKAKPTKSYAGIEICGDYEDFDALQDAIYDISNTEYNACLGYGSVLQHFLGLAYDIRHAKQGDREYLQLDNGSKAWNVDWETNKKRIKNLPANNVYYAVKIPVIQLIFDLFVLDELIEIKKEYLNNKLTEKPIDSNLEYEDCKNDLERVMLSEAKLEKMHQDLARSKSEKVFSKSEITLQQMVNNQYAVSVLETFRLVIYQAIDDIIGLEERIKVESIRISKDRDQKEIYKNYLTQYVEDIEMQYLALTKAKRKKSLADVLLNLIYGKEEEDYKDMEKHLRKEALKRGAPISEVRYQYDFDWDDIKW